MSNAMVDRFVVLLAALFVLATGALGVGHETKLPGNFDFRFFHAAGTAWLEGANPYDTRVLVEASDGRLDGSCPLAYPPTIAPICMAAAALPYHTSRIVFVWSAFGCAMVVAMMTARAARKEGSPRPLLVAAATLILPATTLVIWLGSVSLLVAVLLLGMWGASRGKRPIAAGILLGLCSIKPQLVLLPSIWLLLEGKFVVIGVAAIVTALLGLLPFLILHPAEVIQGWFAAIRAYPQSPGNQLGFLTLKGLPSLFAAGGVAIPAFVFMAIGAALFWMTWLARTAMTPIGVLGILGGILFTVGYAHDADMVVLAPLVVALATIARRSWMHMGTLVLLGGLMLFRPWMVERTGSYWLVHWKTLIVVGVTLWLLVEATTKWLLGREVECATEAGHAQSKQSEIGFERTVPSVKGEGGVVLAEARVVDVSAEVGAGVGMEVGKV